MVRNFEYDLKKYFVPIVSWQSFKFLISQDIVDILVGWHVDIGQSPSLKMHISSVLLSWHSFWIIDLDFSAGLLRQFIEDVESFTEDVEEYRHDFFRNHLRKKHLKIEILKPN